VNLDRICWSQCEGGPAPSVLARLGSLETLRGAVHQEE
jgi:hypothetical protein